MSDDIVALREKEENAVQRKETNVVIHPHQDIGEHRMREWL